MRPHGNKYRLIAMATLVVAGAWNVCQAQVGPPCSNGHCGSPLAGPCAPARMTYGYVPTQWRRWPTVQASATLPAPEELPTPANSDALPEPELPSPRSTVPRESTPRPSGDTLTPPFGPSTLSPPMTDEPPAAPFGDEPVAPPSAADPLADPFGDEPPAPPADQTPSSPSSQDSVPNQFPPLDEPAPPASETDSLFESEPAMPAEDPFKDDPEPSATPDAGADTRLERNDRAAEEPIAAALQGGPREQDAAQIDVEMSPQASEPRLLRADGESLEPGRLTTQIQDDPNPLRQVSHPVRKTAYKEAAVASPPARAREASVWRRNPLRAN